MGGKMTNLLGGGKSDVRIIRPTKFVGLHAHS